MFQMIHCIFGMYITFNAEGGGNKLVGLANLIKKKTSGFLAKNVKYEEFGISHNKDDKSWDR